MTKVIALGIAAAVALGVGAAYAQTGSAGSATSAGAAAPAAGAAAPTAGSAAPSEPPAAPGDASGSRPALPPPNAREICVAAMNADPAFAASVIKVIDAEGVAKRDADTVLAHEAADARVKKNERHVVYAYAAMWIIAAAFVIFLWRRQEALKAEIASLRRDLDAADDTGATKATP